MEYAIFDLSPPSDMQASALEQSLTDKERELLLNHAEEAPFCGVFLYEERGGTYCCRLCGLPLFKAATKFESGTGWPSFTTPFRAHHLREIEDTRYGLKRTEITCARCGSHQGHVFPDGPPPGGLRYCINSGSLEFIPTGALLPDKLDRGSPEGEPLSDRVA